MCRTGKADASVSGPNNMSGLWWVAGNLVRNLAALNNVEMLPRDRERADGSLIRNSGAEAIGSGIVAPGELQQLLLRIRKPAFGDDAA
jgi:hypothetical protein